MKSEYQKLWDALPKDIPSNLIFANLVSKQEPENTRYFFGDYSLPILKWISISVYSSFPIEDSISLILSDYYYFVAAPFDENATPHFYQLTSYRGINDMKLESWLKKNGKQFFVKNKNKENKINKNNVELLEFVDYDALLHLDCEATELSDEEILNHKSLKAAWDSLTDKDKDILHFLVQQKLYWEDAYEELNHYISPKGGREVMKSWSNKRKQDALALMKARAIEHLIVKFNTVKRNLT